MASQRHGECAIRMRSRRPYRAGEPEIVIHMAAQSLVRRSFSEPRETYETNVMGTVNLLDAVRATEACAVVVNVTSDKCYENREWEWGYREDEPMGGHDPYSNSKGCAELVTARSGSSFFSDPDGAAWPSARAGNVIGGGDWARDRLVPDIMRAALAGEPIRVRNPEAVRPWQHVLNPLSGYLAARPGAVATRPSSHAAGTSAQPDEERGQSAGSCERMAELWPGELRWELDGDPHPHEARYLKLDSSRARAQPRLAPTVAGYGKAREHRRRWYRRLRTERTCAR